MRDLPFERIFKLGMDDLVLIKAAVMVDRDGEVLAIAGDLLEQEATPLVTLVMNQMKTELSNHVLAGEIVNISAENEIIVAVQKRQQFLIAITRDGSERALEQVRELRDHAFKVLADRKEGPIVVWNPGGDLTGIGFADLPAIEYSFDAVRPRAKA